MSKQVRLFFMVTLLLVASSCEMDHSFVGRVDSENGRSLAGEISDPAGTITTGANPTIGSGTPSGTVVASTTAGKTTVSGTVISTSKDVPSDEAATCPTQLFATQETTQWLYADFNPCLESGFILADPDSKTLDNLVKSTLIEYGIGTSSSGDKVFKILASNDNPSEHLLHFSQCNLRDPTNCKTFDVKLYINMKAPASSCPSSISSNYGVGGYWKFSYFNDCLTPGFEITGPKVDVLQSLREDGTLDYGISSYSDPETLETEGVFKIHPSNDKQSQHLLPLIQCEIRNEKNCSEIEVQLLLNMTEEKVE